MKKLIKGFWILIFVLIFTGGALADVLPWPDNPYFQENEEDMEYLSGGYMVNCAGEAQEFYSAPGKKTVEFTVARGEIVYPAYRCTERGTDWCIVERFGGNYSSGWCPMEALLPLYNSWHFIREHTDEIGEGFTMEFEKDTRLYFYSYPGSGVTSNSISASNHESVQFDRSYTDKEGRKWGFISYLYGIRDCWLCVDDPTNDSLPFVSAAMKNDGSYIEAYTIPEYLGIPPVEETVSEDDSIQSEESEDDYETPLEHQEDSVKTFLITLLIVSLLVIISVLGLMCINKKCK